MNSFSWMTRSSFACVSIVTVPISSKKIEPPSAASKRPFLFAIAPVNAPLTCPKRLDSSSSAGIEPELTVMKGAPERGECVWIARATSSLPVPLSPSTRIVERDGPGQADELEHLAHPGRLADDAPEAEAQGRAPRAGAGSPRSGGAPRSPCAASAALPRSGTASGCSGTRPRAWPRWRPRSRSTRSRSPRRRRDRAAGCRAARRARAGRAASGRAGRRRGARASNRATASPADAAAVTS